ncbi:hypothetical protein BCR33DRAFT_716577, partial [Rhizoclosmatium globosum]
MTIISGLGIEVALHGLVSVCFCLATLQTKADRKMYIISTLLIVCNISGIIYILMELYLEYVVGSSSCSVAGFIDNLSSHLLLISFEAIILYKCYFITNQNKYALFCIYLVSLHRIVWMAADMFRSYALWDDSQYTCVYFQDSTTGSGYNVADIICDAFATFTALTVACLRMNLNSKYIQTMIIRTIGRTVLVIAASCWVLAITSSGSENTWYYIAWNTQTYVLLRMANLDVLLNSAQRQTSSKARWWDTINWLELRQLFIKFDGLSNSIDIQTPTQVKDMTDV